MQTPKASATGPIIKTSVSSSKTQRVLKRAEHAIVGERILRNHWKKNQLEHETSETPGPIFSCTVSACHSLNRFVVDIVNPLTVKSLSSVRN